LKAAFIEASSAGLVKMPPLPGSGVANRPAKRPAWRPMWRPARRPGTRCARS